MKKALYIYIANAILIAICVILFTPHDSYIIITILFCILTTAVINTLVIYVYHILRLIQIKTIQKYKIVCMCAFLTFVPLIIDSILVEHYDDIVFYDIKTPNSLSHTRCLWSKLSLLQLYTYVILALVLLSYKHILCKRKK